MNFLCLEFVNSSWYITHKLFIDPLQDAAWLLKLAEKWKVKPIAMPSGEDLTRLVQMRRALAGLLEKCINGGQLSCADLELVNSYMRNNSFHRQIRIENSIYILGEIPDSDNWGWFMSEVAASFASLCSTGAINHLKACQNPECNWLFIDDSKGGNRKWCDDTCATLMKVRRFRQKQKENTK